MSRSGYSDDCSGRELNLWRGAVESAIRGKRGQAFLREMLVALDAMPEKRLIAGELVTPTGEVCAWCYGDLPEPIHCREGQDGSLFCSGHWERKYEADVLGIDEVYG